jgi:lipoprotein signal peptidase
VLRVGPIHTGVFNVADFAVVVGMILLVACLRAGPHTCEVYSSDKEARR